MGLKQSVPAIELASDDIVVFVVGPSGCGKSAFVKQVTDSDFIEVGTNLSPRTKTVKAVRCKLTHAAKTALRPGVVRQENIVFVDTPSFNTGVPKKDKTAEKKMTEWLQKSKCSSTLLGTIYMHRIETDPRNDSIQRHLDTFASTFPENFAPFPNRVHAVLSYYESVGRIHEGTIEARKAAFETQRSSLKRSLAITWASSLHPKLLQVEDRDTAWQAVAALVLSMA